MILYQSIGQSLPDISLTLQENRNRSFSSGQQSETKVSPPDEISAPQHKHSHLLHIDINDHYQFITFRTQDSVDAYLKKLVKQNLPNRERQLAIDQYLDQSKSGAYLNGDVLLAFNTFIKTKDTVLYELIAFCIMPNHVHLLIKPLDKLAKVMQNLKGGSARLINEMMGRKGKFWALDYYDKLIRDAKHFSVVYHYIKNNPAVLCEAKVSPPRFYSIYE